MSGNVGYHLYNLFLALVARPGRVSNRCGESGTRMALIFTGKNELLPRIFGI
jgi:hypothetical protein